MPLPSQQQGAKQCTAKSKRSGVRCLNNAAYGCRTCRMHGAQKPEAIKRGKNHPKYINGNFTQEALLEKSAASLRLQQLEDAMHLLGMTTAKRSPGRKANGYFKIKSLDEIKKVIGS